jgi:hypothetical protein
MPFAALSALVTKAAQVPAEGMPLVPVVLKRLGKFAVLDKVRIRELERPPAGRHPDHQPPIHHGPMKHRSSAK